MIGKRNAEKAEEDKLTSHLHILCKPEDKAAWVKAAKGKKLSAWVKEALNEKSQQANIMED